MRIRSSWVFKLFLTVFSVLLLAGTVSLMAPADALAVGGDVTISGPGLNSTAPVIITQNQLRSVDPLSDGTTLQQQDVIYSTINTWPTKSWYRGQGVKLTDLLNLAGGVKPEATQIKFTSRDGFSATFTVEELLNAPRYRFPNFMSTGLPGHLPGDPSGKVLVDTIIAHQSFSAQSYDDTQDPENFSRADANHLLYGQRAVTQQTNARFAKYVQKIEVLTDPAPKWDDPTVTPEAGVVPAGTMVEMHAPFDDEDKVHYTIDGSDPTIDSPMYNWIAKRWWSSRQDELDQINHKIPINSDTTIKAIVIGPGRSDSEIVTFSYQVPDPPALAVDVTDNIIGQQVELTFKDDSDWRAAVTGVSVDGADLVDGKYTVTVGMITIAADVFTEAKDYSVVVKAAGYEDAAVVQTIEETSGPNPVYTVTPKADDVYTAGTTQEGINTMTVNDGVTGFKYFTVNIAPVVSHSGNETVIFAHFRNGSQLGLNATRADFDQVEIAQAGFNVQSGDVIKAYIVDNLTNAIDLNPIILQ